MGKSDNDLLQSHTALAKPMAVTVFKKTWLHRPHTIPPTHTDQHTRVGGSADTTWKWRAKWRARRETLLARMI